MAAAEAWGAALLMAQLWVLASVCGVAVADAVAVGLAVGVAVAVGEAHSPIANLFRWYFAIPITGADAVLVADAARPCVVQP